MTCTALKRQMVVEFKAEMHDLTLICSWKLPYLSLLSILFNP